MFAGYDHASISAGHDQFRVSGLTSAVFLAVPKFNTAQAVNIDLSAGAAPRLCVGINAATPPPLRSGTFSGDAALARQHDVATIAGIVRHIASRLQQPLDAAWVQQGGKMLPHSPTFAKTPQGIADANEFWARQVTEMAAFTPYGGPTVTYGTGKNEDFLSSNLAPGASDKFYGLTMACENLASFAVASRGTNPFPKTTLEAGSVSSKITADAGGKWFIAKTEDGSASKAKTPFLEEVSSPDGSPHKVPGYRTGTPNEVRVDRFGEQKSDDAFFGPGSVILFSNRAAHPHDPNGFNEVTASNSSGKTFACRVEANVEICAKLDGTNLSFTGPFAVHPTPENGEKILRDHTSGAHIGPVIRISPDGKKVQTLDTGGFSVDGRGSGRVPILGAASGFHSGNVDDELTNTIKSKGGEPMRGVGAFKRITSGNQADFEKQLQALLEARPLGFVRLALTPAGSKVTYPMALRPQDGWLLFLSPLLPMYGKDKHQNFHISRYLWSLREAPGFDKGVDAWWLFYAPRWKLAQEMMKGGARGKTAVELAEEAFPRADVARVLHKNTLVIMNAKVESSGRVVITNNKYNNLARMHRIHYAEGNWKGHQLPMDQFFVLKKNTPASNFPPELVPPGTLQVDYDA